MSKKWLPASKIRELLIQRTISWNPTFLWCICSASKSQIESSCYRCVCVWFVWRYLYSPVVKTLLFLEPIWWPPWWFHCTDQQNPWQFPRDHPFPQRRSAWMVQNWEHWSQLSGGSHSKSENIHFVMLEIRNKISPTIFNPNTRNMNSSHWTLYISLQN